jgi:hypothetical protein
MAFPTSLFLVSILFYFIIILLLLYLYFCLKFFKYLTITKNLCNYLLISNLGGDSLLSHHRECSRRDSQTTSFRCQSPAIQPNVHGGSNSFGLQPIPSIRRPSDDATIRWRFLSILSTCCRLALSSGGSRYIHLL